MKPSSKKLSRQHSCSLTNLKIHHKLTKQKQQISEKQYLRKSTSSFKQFNMMSANPVSQTQNGRLNQNEMSINVKKQKVKIKTENANTSVVKDIKDNNRKKNQGDEEVADTNILGWTTLDKIKYQLTIERRLRESLQREVQTLKKEIAFLNNFGASVRTSFNSKKACPEQPSNKQKILNRLNRKREGVSGLEKDNDSTGLLSAKTTSNENRIQELYYQYEKGRIVPTLQDIHDISKSYFKDFQQNYSKLLVLFQQCKSRQKDPLFSKMEDLLFLFQVPIFYKQKPKQLLRSLSKSKQKQANSKSKQHAEKLDIWLKNRKKSEAGQSLEVSKESRVRRKQKTSMQGKSPQEVFSEFLDILEIVVKNGSMVKSLAKTQLCAKLMRKIKQLGDKKA